MGMIQRDDMGWEVEGVLGLGTHVHPKHNTVINYTSIFKKKILKEIKVVPPNRTIVCIHESGHKHTQHDATFVKCAQVYICTGICIKNNLER